MKRYVVLLLCMYQTCKAQQWEAEILAGVAGYNGDLTEQVFSPKSMGPALGFNLKYNFNNLFLARGGIAWGQVQGNDKNNHQADLRNRNLNFHSDPVEGDIRGNPKVKDWYFVTSLKLLMRLGKRL